MDLQAFIFCGKGFKLSPFSHINGDNGIPKALLPVANRPMIEYVLDWCDQAQFKEINVIIEFSDFDLVVDGLRSYLSLRQQYFELHFKNISSHHGHCSAKLPNINFISSKYESTGEILQKELLGRITGDFVLLPCDFITDIPPQIFLDQYQNKDVNNLAMAVYYNNSFENIDKKYLTQFFTVYTDNNDSDEQPILLDIYSKDDIDKTKYLQIRAQMLWRYPNSTVSTKIFNSFMYFCSYDLVHLLSNETKPIQFDSELNESDDERDSYSYIQAKPSYLTKKKLIKDHLNCNRSLVKVFRDLARRSWKHSKPRETIGLFTLPDISIFIRADNLSAYMEANRYILKRKYFSTIHPAPISSPVSVIGADSIIGANCTILEKTNIKCSVLGTSCKVGKRCRIVGSIILDGVEIDDETTLENVIIGKLSKIGKKCRLTNCYVEGSYNVNSKTVLKGETLANIYLNSDDFDDTSLDDDSSDDLSGHCEECYDEDEFEDDGLFER